MAFVVKDRVRESCSAPGLGTVTLLGAVAGYVSFSVIGNSNSTYYCISDPGGAWEVGIGTYTASGTTLSRDTVLSNSSGTTAKINFSAGTQDVFVTLPAEKSIATVATTSPSGLSQATMWWNSETGNFSIYYPDGSSNQFVGTMAGGLNMDYSDLNGGTATTTSWSALIIDGGGAT